MRVWDDNEIPIAFLITFRTYGTWLHGNERGSVDRLRNVYDTPRLPKRPGREAYNRMIMQKDHVILDRQQIKVVHKTIQDVCHHKDWGLFASNVRTNHAHAVIAGGGRNPSRVLNVLKSYSTRRLREAELWNEASSPWARKGSMRWLWDQDSVDRACNYVQYCQGPDLIRFEDWELRKNPPANAGGSSY